ncbi:uncharacterized protein LOC106160963 [Lingula anatina]|uniref:Uncharacterized protein LOC106160963 n=1 Tax=Lingula anatina TaxID=7574 RepID=A0A1S3I4T3_LINAN|nr:uncharacterized protein LOC106160963 [Lingula anatina]|eukprot:XP_013393233.1 uncharacterized protein LOC106160963 [Lingula anatina]
MVVTILVIVIVVIKRRKHAQSESKERGAFNNPSYTENIRAVSVRDAIYSEPNDDYMPREGGDHPHQTTCSEMNAEHYYQKLQYSNQSQEENIYAQIVADEDIAESYIDFSA